MDAEFASQKFGTAISILVSHVGRINDRLRVAYTEALSRVPRKDIPEELLNQYDSIMDGLKWIEGNSPAPSEDEASMLATALEDLTSLLHDEVGRH
jgi:hypothetical protein